MTPTSIPALIPMPTPTVRKNRQRRTAMLTVGGLLGLGVLMALTVAPARAAELILDNGTAQFSTIGTWPTSTAGTGFQGTNYQTHAANGLVPGAQPVDNPAGVATGTWPTSTSSGGYLGSNYQVHAAGSGTNQFAWPLTGDGRYRVYARWTAGNNRAHNAPYTVHHADGETLLRVDQQLNGGTWQLLGTYPLDSQSQVTLTDNADGYVIADAVMSVPESAPLANSATWTPALSTPGRYDVHAQWAASSNRASNAPYTIHHHDGATTVRVSQKANGGTWQALGTYTLDPDSRITLTDDADGYVIADALRLVPVSAADPTPTVAQLYYLHTDHLDTPRLVTDAQNTVVWRNDPLAEPFGNAPPDEDPDGDGQAFTFHLRFPGQYFDPETNTHYNYYRDYDPSTGRYIQSDPIGLQGGINTYGYVGESPLGRRDPQGLRWDCSHSPLISICRWVSDDPLFPLLNPPNTPPKIPTLDPCVLSPVLCVIVTIADHCLAQVKTPNKGEPGSWHTNPGSGQERLYGPSGEREVDIDWDHDHGQGQPHVHNGPEREVPEGGFSPWPRGRGNPAQGTKE